MAMGPGRWSRVKDVFEAARALPADARTPYVRDACGGDDDLRQEIESLLAAYEPARSFLEAPAAQMFPHLRHHLAGLSTHRSLRGLVADRSRRHGRRLQGRRYASRSHRRDQDPAGALCGRSPGARSDSSARRAPSARSTTRTSARCTTSGSQDGIDFLVMEYLEGETLAARLAQGPLPLDQALALRDRRSPSRSISAHRAGIVHRDLKPGNIMLTKAGRSCSTSGWPSSTQRRRHGSAMHADDAADADGAGHHPRHRPYMAPEQLEGQGGGRAHRHLRVRRRALRDADRAEGVRGARARRA